MELSQQSVRPGRYNDLQRELGFEEGENPCHSVLTMDEDQDEEDTIVFGTAPTEIREIGDDEGIAATDYKILVLAPMHHMNPSRRKIGRRRKKRSSRRCLLFSISVFPSSLRSSSNFSSFCLYSPANFLSRLDSLLSGEMTSKSITQPSLCAL